MVDGMSVREASRVFGLHRDTVRKMLKYAAPPGYRRRKPPRRPKIGPYTGVIDEILRSDMSLPKKQRHTAKRIYERLRDERGFEGGYTIVKDYVRERRRTTREMFVPLFHPAGHAQSDFGEAWAVIDGVKRKVHFFVLSLPLVTYPDIYPELRQGGGEIGASHRVLCTSRSQKMKLWCTRRTLTTKIAVPTLAGGEMQ